MSSTTPSRPPAARSRAGLGGGLLAALLLGGAVPGSADQFRISDMGGTGESTRDAYDAAVAYNSQRRVPGRLVGATRLPASAAWSTTSSRSSASG
jgi:hypothetical protein